MDTEMLEGTVGNRSWYQDSFDLDGLKDKN